MQIARDAAGITDPDCQAYDLPADYEAGKLTGFGLLAYEQLIRKPLTGSPHRHVPSDAAPGSTPKVPARADDDRDPTGHVGRIQSHFRRRQ